VTIPVIIDTDPGVDDAVALMLAAASPQVRLLGVTTVFGNATVELTTANALRLRTLAGFEHVPVAAGASRPLVYPYQPRGPSHHGPDALAGQAHLLPPPGGPPDALSAVALMATLLRQASAPVTLVTIAPLTNVALLLATHPETKPRIKRIVAMAGNLSGLPAETNVRLDPEAARRVLVEEDVPATVVPLEVTSQVTVDAAWVAELAAAGPRCALLAGIITAASQGHPMPLRDALAVLEAAAPGTLASTPMRVDVVCDHGVARGVVLVDTAQASHKRVVEVARAADPPSIRAALLNRLRRLR
jgi:pyrimidine-specific ribonucleoside hydrolase